MGLIKPTTPPNVLNRAQKIALVVSTLRTRATALHTTMRKTHDDMHSLVHENPDGITRNEILLALGDDAGQFVELAADVKAILDKVA